MAKFWRWLAGWLLSTDTVFVLALIAIGVGCAMERPSLGLIVPGSIVCGLMVCGRLRGG